MRDMALTMRGNRLRSTMSETHDFAINHAEAAAIRGILGDALSDPDPGWRAARDALARVGLAPHDALGLLVRHRSQVKYGYTMAPATPPAILSFTDSEPAHGVLDCIERPFLLLKSCWLYEHAPCFAGIEGGRAERIKGAVLPYLQHYRAAFLEPPCARPASVPHVDIPKRVCTSSFWERELLTPMESVQETARRGFEGVEYNIDFHPFNAARLLPEEIGPEARSDVREACRRLGVAIDIHSPIVGPYGPSPDPRTGSPLFMDPLARLLLQREAVQLARDVGARAIVFHLIDLHDAERYAELVAEAEGSDLRVTIENYCSLDEPQPSEVFVRGVEAVRQALPEALCRRNFGITVDPGHLNVEGEDPLVGVARIGAWCREHGIFLRMHATDNYGPLPHGPQHFSADIHDSVSGRGIDNGVIIKLLRSLGHNVSVVAEQINDVAPVDVDTIHGAQVCDMPDDFEGYAARGRAALASSSTARLLQDKHRRLPAYQFLAGLQGVEGLQEYTVYRHIQEHGSLSVDDAHRLTTQFMGVPAALKPLLSDYMDDLLLPVGLTSELLRPSPVDLVAQTIHGEGFWDVGGEQIGRLFARSRVLRAGDMICEADEPGTEMIVVEGGVVETVMAGQPAIALPVGAVFGEMALFYSIPRLTSLRATADGTRIAVLSRDELADMLAQPDASCDALVKRLRLSLPKRVQHLARKVRAFGGPEGGPDVDHRGVASCATLYAELRRLDRVFRELRSGGPRPD